MTDRPSRTTAPLEQDDGRDASLILELDSFLPYRLNLLAERVSRSFSQIYANQLGIGIPEWRVLAIIGQYGRVTSKEIGIRSTMHKTKVSRAVSALEAKGYVVRAANPLDMRESYLELTASGRQTYTDLVPQALAFSNELMNALTPDQKQVLSDIYDRLLEAADDFKPGAKN
ncbi:DNA-binding MarR family transcriptional regulator [Roseibium hamelinense]|uniref:DNA-binding MarR family transcriptional regulator n=1 Tax=Roseibium hamelinense TaxID=150831 RepID=A0A562T7P2_9HYPH|nr:MarR family transcriptional regulator [Roseibium hamelinense]TWI89669.1 DNA-binding MarR family transcriptional regulator [Roseibium hamelinense]